MVYRRGNRWIEMRSLPPWDRPSYAVPFVYQPSPHQRHPETLQFEILCHASGLSYLGVSNDYLGPWGVALEEVDILRMQNYSTTDDKQGTCRFPKGKRLGEISSGIRCLRQVLPVVRFLLAIQLHGQRQKDLIRGMFGHQNRGAREAVRGSVQLLGVCRGYLIPGLTASNSRGDVEDEFAQIIRDQSFPWRKVVLIWRKESARCSGGGVCDIADEFIYEELYNLMLLCSIVENVYIGDKSWIEERPRGSHDHFFEKEGAILNLRNFDSPKLSIVPNNLEKSIQLCEQFWTMELRCVKPLEQ